MGCTRQGPGRSEVWGQGGGTSRPAAPPRDSLPPRTPGWSEGVSFQDQESCCQGSRTQRLASGGTSYRQTGVALFDGKMDMKPPRSCLFL